MSDTRPGLETATDEDRKLVLEELTNFFADLLDFEVRVEEEDEEELVRGRGQCRREDAGYDADDGGPGQDYNSAYQDLCDPWGY